LQRICYVSLDAIKTQVQELLNERKSPLPPTFAVVPRVRSCNSIDKAVLIDTLASLVDQTKCKVDLTNPDLVILVEAMKNVAACSLLDGALYKKYAKLSMMNLFADKKKDVGAEEVEAGDEKKEAVE